MNPTLDPTSYCDLCRPVLLQPVDDATAMIENLTATVRVMQKTMDDLMNGFTATVQVIQNTDLPAVAALSQSNAAN